MVDGPEASPLGYSTVFTDAGHEQDPSTPDLTWAVSETGVVNMPAIIDFQFRAVHQVTVATKQYVEAYYSQPIDHSYFDGCSNGGRQSLMEGEHYPVDYDGLVAGDALIERNHGVIQGLFQRHAAGQVGRIGAFGDKPLGFRVDAGLLEQGGELDTGPLGAGSQAVQRL
jgi:hypothetical protein